MVPTSPLPQPGLSGELRQLFVRGEYEALLIRTENLQKRKRVEDATTKQFVDLVHAMSLIQLGRCAEAAPLLSNVEATGPKPVLDALKFAQLYIGWATNEAVESAATEANILSGDDARHLEAQLLYRCGRYDQAAEMYLSRFRAEKVAMEEKQKPAATSRWRLMSRGPEAAQLTAPELDRHTASVNELATNAMAALTLAERPGDAVALKSNLKQSYEMEYNMACANISQSQFTQAEIGLQQAEALIRAEMDDDDNDVHEALAPVVVQKAYLRHLAGEVAEAKEAYVEIMAGGGADAASLAVAANNLTVALGQLAFGRSAPVQGEKTMLPKEQHEALVEGLKKMRATSGKNVERKLTINQRRAMARNRAILLVQMGRMDMCRTELAKLKSEFPGDTVVTLIEASLIARQSGLDTADKVLQLTGDDDKIRAARVQLAVAHGNHLRAAELLQELFAGRPAAVATAARLLEDIGRVDDALALAKGLVSQCTPEQAGAAKKMVAGMQLRAGKYEEAAAVLREVVEVDGKDSTAIAQLVVATSYFDGQEAEQAASRILPMLDTHGIDASVLEGRPPPKRKQVAALKSGEGGAGGTTAERDAAFTREHDLAERAAAARLRKKMKRKKRLPKNYDPEGPPPDPERWLPKTLRAGYKKKKGGKNDNTNNFKGSQGADAAAADAAAVKNAERAAAKAVGVATDGASGPGGRGRAQRKKKNRK